MTTKTKYMLLQALCTQVSICKSINALKSIGLLLEPDAKKSGSIANYLYDALSANSKSIYRLMGMSDDIPRREAFDKAISDYSKQFPNATTDDIEKHFFETKYNEVRYDFMDGILPVSIDAYLTDDDNEEGRVIAQIDRKTKHVKYLDNDACYDPYAQDIIQAAIGLLRFQACDSQDDVF